MLFILIIVLIIVAIVLSILKKKNLITFNFSGKKIIIILLIFVILYGIFTKRHDIIFFFQSLEYENIDKYDYNNDITNNGYISKEGAIKIAKEKTKKKRIAKVTCELIENGTYINYDEVLKNILDNTSDTSNYKKQATFWFITLTTGWNGHAEEWNFKIDYYTGEILQYDVTM